MIPKLNVDYSPLVSDFKIKRIDHPNGRRYQTPDGVFPSVTTVIDAAKDKNFLVEWRKRVGDDEADRISNLMKNFGTRLHAYIEESIKRGSHPPAKDYGYDVLESWLDLAPQFQEKLNKVVGLETQMYSKTIQMAGTTDCLGYWDGVPSIIDFKTSYKTKKEEWITDYFVQGVFYAVMAQERFGFKAKQIVIPVFTRFGQPNIFIKKVAEYHDSALRTIERAREAGVYSQG